MNYSDEQIDRLERAYHNGANCGSPWPCFTCRGEASSVLLGGGGIASAGGMAALNAERARIDAERAETPALTEREAIAAVVKVAREACGCDVPAGERCPTCGFLTVHWLQGEEVEDSDAARKVEAAMLVEARKHPALAGYARMKAETPAPVAVNALTDDEIKRAGDEGREVRREMERRTAAVSGAPVAPSTRPPWRREPPTAEEVQACEWWWNSGGPDCPPHVLRLDVDDGRIIDIQLPSETPFRPEDWPGAELIHRGFGASIEDVRAVIEEVEPRRNAFSRRASGERPEEQVVAANLDQVLIVASMHRPDFKHGFVDRVLAQGSLGLGESYMDGWWDCDQLDELIHRVLRGRLDAQVGQPGWWWAALRARLTNLQTVASANWRAWTASTMWAWTRLPAKCSPVVPSSSSAFPALLSSGVTQRSASGTCATAVMTSVGGTACREPSLPVYVLFSESLPDTNGAP